MARKRTHRRTYDIPGHAHALTFSCYRNQPYFRSDRACGWLLEAIIAARVKLDFRVWAYVFMPDHIHLLVCPNRPIYKVSSIRSRIKSPVGCQAIAYVREHHPDALCRFQRVRGGQVESLFWQSGGGYDRNIDSTAALMAEIDRIHLNPVKAGFVKEAADWRWSSASTYVGGECDLTIDPIPPQWLEIDG